MPYTITIGIDCDNLDGLCYPGDWIECRKVDPFHGYTLHELHPSGRTREQLLTNPSFSA